MILAGVLSMKTCIIQGYFSTNPSSTTWCNSMLKRPHWLKNERFFAKKEVWRLRLRFKVLLLSVLLLLIDKGVTF